MLRFSGGVERCKAGVALRRGETLLKGLAVPDRIALLMRALCLSAVLAPTIAAAPAPAARPQLSDALALALGQKKPEMSLGVAAIVNDNVISDYDLDQRV